jgi:hypothetical protein
MHLPEAGDGFSVRVNGQSVIEGATALSLVQRRGGTAGPVRGYTVWILLDRARRRGRAGGRGLPGPNAAWAIDNVSVIASGRTS